MEPSRHRRTASGEALLPGELERVRALSRQPAPDVDDADAEVADIFDCAPSRTNMAALGRATQHAAAEQATVRAGVPLTSPACRVPAAVVRFGSPPAVTMFEVEAEVSSQVGSPRGPTWLGWKVARIGASRPDAAHPARDASRSSRGFDRSLPYFCCCCCCFGIFAIVLLLLLIYLPSASQQPAVAATSLLPPTTQPAPALPPPAAPGDPGSPFIGARGGQFYFRGRPHRFVGANMWYAAWLGCSTCATSDRPRLIRELDALRARGITHLRVLACSEGPPSSPWRVSPPLQPAEGQFDETVAEGLDFLLAKLQARGMVATLTLNNMWPWSGGFGQFVSWATGEPIPYPPPAQNGSWDAYANYAARFYGLPRAQAAADAAVRFVLRRNVTIPAGGTGDGGGDGGGSGVGGIGGGDGDGGIGGIEGGGSGGVVRIPYSSSPAIFAWELANEPRPMSHRVEYLAWIERQAALIRSLDGNHLVTIGSEGATPYPEAGLDVVADHAHVDFMTVHVWPQNWGWYSPTPAADAAASLAAAVPQVRFYLSDHLAFAVLLNKPAVLEEFGLARDATPAQGETFSPVPTDSLRRQMYETIFGAVIDALPPMCADTDTAVGDEIGGSADPGGGADTVGGGHFSGVSFWGWAGEGRPRQPGGVWAVGDHLIGDPPHEPQGWYSVYDTDEQMGQLLNRTAAAMRGACGG